MIRAPKQFNGQFINRHFYEYEFQNNLLYRINSGECYDWAYYGHRLFGAELWTTDYHAWCRVGKKYHDSETGKYGVLNFMNLGCNVRNAFPIPWEDKPPQALPLEEFKKFWSAYSYMAENDHWTTMLEPELQRVLGKLYREATPIFPIHGQKIVEINNGFISNIV